MAQFGRPISDISVTSFTGTPNNTTLYVNLDESTASDTDYLYGNVNTVASYECGLTSLSNPNDTSGHIMRYRIARVDSGGSLAAGGTELTMSVSLYQGASLIASASPLTTSGTWTSYAFPLSTGQAATITDYTNLRFVVSTTQAGGNPANRRGGAVSWLELEIPDVTATTTTTTIGFPRRVSLIT